MSRALDHVAYLSQEIGPHPAGTEEEQQAALYIADTINHETSMTAVVEDFNGSSGQETATLICSAVIVICALLSLALSFFAVPCLIVALVAAGLNLLEFFDRPVLSRLSKKNISQNVVAKFLPAQAEGGAARHRKVILVARYDSGKERMELKESMLPFAALLSKISLAGTVAVPVLLLVRTLFFRYSTGFVAILFAVLIIAALLCVLAGAAVALSHRFSSFNEAANVNSAGVAVLMEVARKVGQREFSAESFYTSSGASGRTGSVAANTADSDFAPVMHGETAAYDSGIVPEGARLEYSDGGASSSDREESLGAAKEAIAALTGRPVSESVSYSVPAAPSVEAAGSVQGALSASSGAAASAESGQAAAIAAAGAVAAGAVAASAAAGLSSSESVAPADAKAEADEEDDGVPAWFKSAKKKARKSEGGAPVERSRFADAFDKSPALAQSREEEPASPAKSAPAPAGAPASTAPTVGAASRVPSAAFAPAPEPAPEPAPAPAPAPAAPRQAPAVESVYAVTPEQAAAQFARASSRASRDAAVQETNASASDARRAPLSAVSSASDAPAGAPVQMPAAALYQASVSAAHRSSAPQPTDAVPVASASSPSVAPSPVSVAPAPAAFVAMPAVPTAAPAAVPAATPAAVPAMAPANAAVPAEAVPAAAPSATVAMSAPAAAPSAADAAPASSPIPAPAAEPGKSERFVLPAESLIATSGAPTGSVIGSVPIRSSSRSSQAQAVPSVVPLVSTDAGQYAPLAAAAEGDTRAAGAAMPLGQLSTIAPIGATGKIPSLSARQAAGTEAQRDEMLAMLPSKSGILAMQDVDFAAQRAASGGKAGCTAAFAPVSMELAQNAGNLEDLYVEDVADEEFDEGYTATGAPAGAGYMDMPKKRGLFGRLFKKKDKDEAYSASEWLDVDEDFNAQDVGRERGGWESFREDAPEAAAYGTGADGTDAALPKNTGKATRNGGWGDDDWDESWNGGAFSGLKKRAGAAAGRASGGRIGGAVDVDDNDDARYAAELDASYGETESTGDPRLDALNAASDDSSSRSRTRGKRRGSSRKAESRRSERADRGVDAQGDDASGESRRERRRSADSGFGAVLGSSYLPNGEDGRADDLKKIGEFHDDGVNAEVWFVALGSQLDSNAGIRAFIEEHKGDLRGAMFIELDGLGAGELSFVEKEGTKKLVANSSRMKRYVKTASRNTGIPAGAVSIPFLDSASSYASQNGFQALHLAGIKGGKQAYFAEREDTIENIEEDKLYENVDFVVELLKSI